MAGYIAMETISWEDSLHASKSRLYLKYSTVHDCQWKLLAKIANEVGFNSSAAFLWFHYAIRSVAVPEDFGGWDFSLLFSAIMSLQPERFLL